MSHDKTFPLRCQPASKQPSASCQTTDDGGILQRLPSTFLSPLLLVPMGTFTFIVFRRLVSAAQRSHSNDVTWKFISARLLALPWPCLLRASNHGPKGREAEALDAICHLNKRAGTASLSVLRARGKVSVIYSCGPRRPIFFRVYAGTIVRGRRHMAANYESNLDNELLHNRARSCMQVSRNGQTRPSVARHGN